MDETPEGAGTLTLASEGDVATDPTPIAEAEEGGASSGGLARGARLGRYVVVGLLGKGGMGEVYRARDPQLDRDVAIKVLRGQLAPGMRAQARLAREAQAMARLAHPNVATIHDVGTFGAHVYLAMELIEGGTLRVKHTPPPPWRAIVADYLQAARGLAAAHAAGLVHRDFKPENVLVGTDGRVRVTDFGLAYVDPDEVSAESPRDLASVETSPSTLLGTPAYMAPEALVGGRVDARADQYAFCLSLYQALYGAMPSRDVVVADVPATPRIPRALGLAIVRGLAERAEDRHASMDALAEVLARAIAPPASRRRIAALALGGVAVAGLVIWGALRGQAEGDPCTGADARLVGVWDPARSAAIEAHLAKVDPGAGGTRATAAAAVFDRRARDWSAMHVDTCRATRVVGNQTESAFALRMRCLDRRLSELGAGARLLETAHDPASLDQAMTAAFRLEPLTACADPIALEHATRLPDDAPRRARAEAIAREVDAIELERKAGRLAGLSARIEAAVGLARALAHDPTLADALALRAKIENDNGEDPAEVATYRELAEVAARAHDDARETMAWSKLMSLLGNELGKPDEARALIPVARASLARAGDPLELRVTVLHAEAAFLGEHGDAARALALLDEARAVLEKLGAGSPGSSLTPVLGDLWLEIGDAHHAAQQLDRAIPAYHHAIELWERAYGPGHADVAWGWHDLGIVLTDADKLDDAIAANAKAIAIREARLGDSQLLAISVISQAETLDTAGRHEEALVFANRARAMYLKLEGPDSLRGSDVLLTMGTIESALGREREARQHYDEALALLERLGAKTGNLITGLYHRAAQSAKLGKCADAIADFQRAGRVGRELQGEHPRIEVYLLVGEAGCHLHDHRPADAVPVLERALAIDPPVEHVAPIARFLLGRALVDAGRDRAKGLAMAKAARVDVDAKDRDFASTIAETDAWLRTQR